MHHRPSAVDRCRSPLGGSGLALLLPLMFALAAAQGNSPLGCAKTTLATLTADADTSYVLQWAQKVGYVTALGFPGLNVTVFMPNNAAVERGLVAYSSGPTFDFETQALQSAEVAFFHSLPSLYTEEDLMLAGGVNTVLGVVKNQDFQLKFSSDDTGALLVTGIGVYPNDVAKVIRRVETCNGQFYVVDALLLPANKTDQVSWSRDPGLIARVFTSASCNTTLAQELRSIEGSTSAAALWTQNGLEALLNETSMAVTVLLPLDEAIAVAAAEDAIDERVVLYNMLSGAYCPEELVDLAVKISMLGEVEQAPIPLIFSRDEDGTVVVTGVDGTSARVVKTIAQCQYVILVTDKVLLPRSNPNNGTLELPAALPTLPDRWLTCNPPVYYYNATSLGSTDASSSDSGSSNNVLAIGLGVGLGGTAILLAGMFAVAHWKRNRASSAKTHAIPAAAALAGGMQGGGSIKLSNVATANSGLTTPATGSTDSRTISGGSQIPLNSVAIPSDYLGIVGGRNDSPPEGTATASGTSRSSLDLGDLELQPDDITIDVNSDGTPVLLGRGSFGVVYRGMLRGVQPAAVKVMMRLGRAEESAFLKEVSILRHVSKDKNVVQLYGVAQLPDRFVLITELMEGGDLRDALSEDKESLMQWQNRGKWIALDVARGLVAVHACKVVHRDLKSKNILLSSRDAAHMVAKVGDLGVSTLMLTSFMQQSQANGMIGTFAWTAPEMIMGQKCTEKVDMYSFGIVLWEIVTGCVPQRGFTELPPANPSCPQGLIDLIHTCMDQSPDVRPTAKQAYDLILTIPPFEQV